MSRSRPNVPLSSRLVTVRVVSCGTSITAGKAPTPSWAQHKLDARRRLQTERKRRRSDQMDVIDWAIPGQTAYGRYREYGRLWFPSKCVLKAIEDQFASPRGKTLVLHAVNQVSPLS